MNVPRGKNRSDTNNMFLTGQSNWLVQIFTQRHNGDSVDDSCSFLSVWALACYKHLSGSVPVLALMKAVSVCVFNCVFSC